MFSSNTGCDIYSKAQNAKTCILLNLWSYIMFCMSILYLNLYIKDVINLRGFDFDITELTIEIIIAYLKLKSLCLSVCIFVCLSVDDMSECNTQN